MLNKITILFVVIAFCSFRLCSADFGVDKVSGQLVSGDESLGNQPAWVNHFKKLESLERQLLQRRNHKVINSPDPRALFKDEISKALMHLISTSHADVIVKHGYPIDKIKRYSEHLFRLINQEDVYRVKANMAGQQLNANLVAGTVHYYATVFNFIGMVYDKLGLHPELEMFLKRVEECKPVMEKWVREIRDIDRRRASKGEVEKMVTELKSKIDNLTLNACAAELARSAFFVANSWSDGKYVNHDKEAYFKNVPTKKSIVRELAHIAREIRQILHVWSSYNFQQAAEFGSISLLIIAPEDFSVFSELEHCPQEISLLLRKTIKIAHIISNSLERTAQETGALLEVIDLWAEVSNISSEKMGRLFLTHEMLDLRILTRISDNLRRSANGSTQTLLDDERSFLQAEKAKKKKKKKKSAAQKAKRSPIEVLKHELPSPKAEKEEMALVDSQIIETLDLDDVDSKDEAAVSRKTTKKKRNRKGKQAKINFCEINWDDIEEEAVSKLLIDFEGAGKQAFLVGGWVRDRCLGLKISDYDKADYDLVIDAEEAQLLAWGEQNSTPVHKDNYVVGLYKIGNKIDVWLRPGLDLKQDALSRDFYVNALYYNRAGIVDPLNQGLEELMKRKPLRIIETDQLPHLFIRSPHSILKAFYLSSKTNLALSDELRSKICEHKSRLLDVPMNVTTDLLNKLFNLDHGALINNRVAAWRMLNGFGVMDILFPNFMTNMEHLNLVDHINSKFLHSERLIFKFEILAWMLLPGFVRRHHSDMDAFLEEFFQKMKANEKDVYVQNIKYYLQKIVAQLN